MPMITLKSIAESFGVSAATVSRILRDPDYKGKDARMAEAIRVYAAKARYHPDSDAAALRRGVSAFPESNTELLLFYARENTDFFFEVSRVVEQQAIINNCSLGPRYGRLDTEKLFLNDGGQENVKRGMIIIGRPKDDGLFDQLYQFYKGNIVFAGFRFVDKPIDQVVCDGYGAARCAMDYLYSLNHRQIAYVGKTKDELRFYAYQAFLKDKGIPLDWNFVVEWPETDGKECELIKAIFKERPVRPTAAFCENDTVALEMLQILRQSGVEVPKHLSIISINNIERVQNAKPLLTTVHTPSETVGYFATKILLGRINGERERNIRVHLPFKLVKRETCRKLQEL